MSEIPQWKPEYSVQNELIDYQHQYLFELCKALAKLQEQSENKLSVEQALAGLLDYIELHFREEEEFYKSHPEFSEHQKIHKDLMEKTKDFAAQFKAEKLELSALLDFVYGWIVDHITKTDIRFFHDIKNKQ